jgi:hypothetical protein
MENLVDIVICDPIDFDSVVFQCWLDGFPAGKALSLKITGGGTRIYPTGRGAVSPRNVDASPAATPRREEENLSNCDWVRDPQCVDLMKYEIFDQYRTYDILSHYIRFPQLLGEQTMVQLDTDTEAFVIYTYYELDDGVVREMLGKKLTKNRKDLDEISESSKCSLQRVTR